METALTVIRPRNFVISAGIECSQMGTLGGLRLNNYNRYYYILNNNKRPYWVFRINHEIP